MKRLALIALLATMGAAPPPSVQVTGLVAHAGPVALAGLPQVTVAASFHTMHGEQAHKWTGPLLRDVLAAAAITDAPGKRTHMRHVIMVSGTDGYAVAIAIGEIESGGENKQVIVALQQDNDTLPAPRLVVPGDTSFTRGVRDLATLEVR
jgi:DMSO/TMAO reductase YedYZ molybdopterin-dependent catalytic subunit